MADNGIENVSQYLRANEKKRLEWDEDDNDQEALWFRGMQSEVNSLEPRLLRNVGLYCHKVPKKCETTLDCEGLCANEIQQAEERLVTLFKNRGRIEISQAEAIMIRTVKSKNADLHYMFRIQHYGGDTRLLDWTANSLNGLYFSLRHNEEIQPKTFKPSVWLLSPGNLLNAQKEIDPDIELDSIPTADDSLIADFLGRKNISDRKKEAREAKVELSPVEKYPVPLVPALDEERIRSQQGRFTLHLKVPGWHPSGEIDNILAQLRINCEKRESILGELNGIGVNEFSLFPDLEGLARHTRRVNLLWS